LKKQNFVQNNHHKISVITINYNRALDLEKTVLSVAKQTHKNFEYIVIDGGSTDGSVSFLEEKSVSITYWVSEPDGGIYDAMNKGTQIASGEWIIFLNAGDTFFSENTLEDLDSFLCPPNDVILGWVDSICDDRYGYRVYKTQPCELSLLWRQIPTCHQSILVRRELQIKYPFDLSLSWCADHDFLAKLYTLKYHFKTIPLTISKFEASGDRKRDLLTYTRERKTIYRKYFEHTFFRDLYFMNEYRGFWIQQNINQRLREKMPREWVIFLRKARGIY
jgi:glycosyltransferase involved in cell wall biosynthesis